MPDSPQFLFTVFFGFCFFYSQSRRMDNLKQCDNFHARSEKKVQVRVRMLGGVDRGIGSRLIHFRCDVYHDDGKQLLGRNKLKTLMDLNSGILINSLFSMKQGFALTQLQWYPNGKISSSASWPFSRPSFSSSGVSITKLFPSFIPTLTISNHWNYCQRLIWFHIVYFKYLINCKRQQILKIIRNSWFRSKIIFKFSSVPDYAAASTQIKHQFIFVFQHGSIEKFSSCWFCLYLICLLDSSMQTLGT